MTVSHLRILIEETGWSPEELGARFGVSGMTIRRWLKKPASFVIGEPYQSAVHQMIRRAVVEKKLDRASKSVQWSLEKGAVLSHEACISLLDCDLDPRDAGHFNEEKVLGALSVIGSRSSCLAEVEKGEREIVGHKSHSGEWSKRISLLLKVTRSASVPSFEKFIAIGALFYLIFPADLIPDHIPVFGLLDDFTMLGFASTYYLNRK